MALQDVKYPSTPTSMDGNEESPRPNKRQRYDCHSSSTPFRQKFNVTSTPNMNGGTHDMYIQAQQNNPVPLPENVVELFRRPHVFPKDSYHELLKANGVAPQIFFKTAKNISAISADVKITPDVIAKKLQKKAMRTSLDNQAEELQEAQNTEDDLSCSSDKQPCSQPQEALCLKSNGAYVVTFKGRQVEFNEVTINLARYCRTKQDEEASNITENTTNGITNSNSLIEATLI